MDMTEFLQWNIHSLQASREELDMLLSHIQPSVISLQETFLKGNKMITFKGYSSFHSFASEINGTPHGGSAILVNLSLPHIQLNLHTSLQAVAIRVSCHKTITVCSIYLPPSMAFNANNFNDLLHQLPPPHTDNWRFQFTQHSLGMHKIGSPRKDGGGHSY